MTFVLSRGPGPFWVCLPPPRMLSGCGAWPAASCPRGGVPVRRAMLRRGSCSTGILTLSMGRRHESLTQETGARLRKRVCAAWFGAVGPATVPGSQLRRSPPLSSRCQLELSSPLVDFYLIILSSRFQSNQIKSVDLGFTEIKLILIK